MAGWSSLCGALRQQLFFKISSLKKGVPSNAIVRCMSGARQMEISPGRWQWHKLKDLIHFYFMIGFIPVVLAITAANIFVGPATLEPIPEGYVPKPWEYYKSPITRFIVRYIKISPQQIYETHLYRLARSDHIRRRKVLISEIEGMIAIEGDIIGYYNPRFRSGVSLYKLHQANGTM